MPLCSDDQAGTSSLQACPILPDSGGTEFCFDTGFGRAGFVNNHGFSRRRPPVDPAVLTGDE
jgi:hypothetical protein